MAHSREYSASGLFQIVGYTAIGSAILGGIAAFAIETRINHSGSLPEPTPGPTMLQVPLLDCDGNVRNIDREFPLIDGDRPTLIGDASLVRQGDIVRMTPLKPGQRTIASQDGKSISYSPNESESYVVYPQEIGNNNVRFTGECLPDVTPTP